MRQITKKEINDLAQQALQAGNPYVTDSIRYEHGDIVLFLYAEKLYSEKELNDAYLETARRDVKNGYGDRGVGYYDKWYRYTRKDEGRAYDLGVKLAAGTTGCAEACHFIG